MATTGSVSTKPLSPMTPCAQASAPARRRSSSEVVALGLATLVMGFLPAPQALATELPLVLSAPGAAAVPASGQGVAAVQANQPVIAQAPGPAAEGGQGQNPPQGLRTEEASLAKQLANPVASLISVPFQFNYDSGIGVQENIQRANLNIQPVVPFNL